MPVFTNEETEALGAFMNDLKSYNWLLISEEQEWTPVLSFMSFHPMSVSLALVPFHLVGRGHNPKDQLQAHTISLDANKVASCTQDGYLVIGPRGSPGSMAARQGNCCCLVPCGSHTFFWRIPQPRRCGVVFHYRPHLKLMLFN